MALTYRAGAVGGSEKGSSWVEAEFGFDPNKLGRLTPQMVDQIAVDRAEMSRQLQMAKVFTKHAEAIMKDKTKVEGLRHDLIQSGLSSKEEIDAIVNKTIMLAQKHEGHIELMLQEMLQGKQMIAAQTFSQKEASQNSFKNYLRETRERHRAKIDTQNTTSQERIRSIQEEASADKSEAKQEQEKARAFASYLNGGERARNARYAIGNGTATSIFAPSAQIGQRQPFGKAGKSGRRSWLSQLFS